MSLDLGGHDIMRPDPHNNFDEALAALGGNQGPIQTFGDGMTVVTPTHQISQAGVSLLTTGQYVSL